VRNGVVLSRNYAVAFLNTFIEAISVDDFLKIRAVLAFWEENKKILYFLDLPGLDFEKKCEVAQLVLDEIDAPEPLKELLCLLMRHKRFFLVRDVLAKICSLYMQRKGILFFDISSAHKLADDEIESVQQFLAQKTEKKILYDYAVDKELIAGIRCQCETLLWEHSAKQQLDDLRRELFLQGTT